MRKILFYMFVLIAAYLLFVHHTGFSQDVAALSTGTVPIINALQGKGA